MLVLGTLLTTKKHPGLAHIIVLVLSLRKYRQNVVCMPPAKKVPFVFNTFCAACSGPFHVPETFFGISMGAQWDVSQKTAHLWKVSHTCSGSYCDISQIPLAPKPFRTRPACSSLTRSETF